MEFRYRDGEAVRRVRVERAGDYFRVAVDDGEAREARVASQDGVSLELEVSGKRLRAHVARDGTRRMVALGPDVHAFAVAERDEPARRSGSGGAMEDSLAAPMPGQVIAVHAAPGDSVRRGQTLVILEAMKMEMRVVAPHDGTVRKVLVATGQVVERGQVVVEMGV